MANNIENILPIQKLAPLGNQQHKHAAFPALLPGDDGSFVAILNSDNAGKGVVKDFRDFKPTLDKANRLISKHISGREFAGKAEVEFQKQFIETNPEDNLAI